MKIQNRYRIYIAKRQLARYKEIHRQLIIKKHFNAIVIQKYCRRYINVNRFKRLVDFKNARRNIIFSKTLIIQRVYRGSVGRKLANQVKQIKFNEKLNKHKLVDMLIKNYSIYKTKKIINEKIKLKKFQIEKIIKIQKIIRGFIVRINFNEIKYEILINRTRAYIIQIQLVWRMKLARNQLKRLIYNKKLLDMKKLKCCIVIQTYIRQYLALKRFRILQSNYQNYLIRKKQLELISIVKIQSHIRRYLDCKKFDQLLKDKKGKWKELYDPVKQIKYYYNTLTNEIRYKMPQDLLDLIPRPVCDNCNEYEATIECAVCSEVYCNQCFSLIHSGGRRKDHNYRALYDYYNKRIDYGESSDINCYPCVWPSDMIQNEIQGWMLRIAPIRDPIATIGPWEVYNDENIQVDRNIDNTTNELITNKIFYFNRLTYEITYDKPIDVMNLENNYESNESQDNINEFGYYDHNGQWIPSSNNYTSNYENYPSNYETSYDNEPNSEEILQLPYLTNSNNNNKYNYPVDGWVDSPVSSIESYRDYTSNKHRSITSARINPLTNSYSSSLNRVSTAPNYTTTSSFLPPLVTSPNAIDELNHKAYSYEYTRKKTKPQLVNRLPKINR